MNQTVPKGGDPPPLIDSIITKTIIVKSHSDIIQYKHLRLYLRKLSSGGIKSQTRNEIKVHNSFNIKANGCNYCLGPVSPTGEFWPPPS